MKSKTLAGQFFNPANLTFVLVSIAGLVSGLTLSDDPFPPLQIAALVGLTVLYILIGVFVFEYFLQPEHLRVSWIYFLIQILIGGLIFFLSRGNAWLILLPLCSHAAVFYTGKKMLAVLAAIAAILIADLILLTSDLGNIIQGVLSFLTAIFFVVVFTQATMHAQRARDEVERLAGELGAANGRLREYAAQVEELAVAKERNRLAREIHDGLGHYLTAINMQIKAAEAILQSEPGRAQESLSKAEALSSDALADVRRSVAALRGDPALARPLVETLTSLIEETRAAGLVAGLAVQGEARPLPPQVELTLYRAVQEGLTNVRKHALASRVDVTLEYRPDCVRLSLEDNGVGQSISPADPAQEGGFGLLGLRERALLLNGSLETSTAPGRGFHLVLNLPVQKGV